MKSIVYRICTINVVLILIVLVFCFNHQVEAAGFSVSNTNDSGTDSFRQAILDANTTGGENTISFNGGISGGSIFFLTPLNSISTTIILNLNSSIDTIRFVDSVIDFGVNTTYVNRGKFTLDGGSDISSSGLFMVAVDDSAILHIKNGADVSNATGYVSYNSGTTGTVTVEGSGSTWVNSAALYVGVNGTGALNILDGADVNNTMGYLGHNSGSIGTVTVDGAGSTWTNSSNLHVGRVGSGTLNIQAGGVVTNTDGYLGHSINSTGIANITGSSSTWTNNSFFYVGRYGEGTLNILNGGTVNNSAKTYIGRFDVSSGTVTIDGAGSTWTISDELIIGYAGGGILNIQNGGALSNVRGSIGNSSGSNGTVTIDGSGSSWTNSYNNLYIGISGTGTLNIQNSGTFNIGSTSGTIYLGYNGGSSGIINIGSGTSSGVIDTGTTGGTVIITGGSGTATVNFNHTDTPYTFSHILTGGLSVSQSGSGTTIIDSSNSYTGGTTLSAGILNLESSGAVGSAGTIIFNGGTLQYSSNNAIDYSSRFSTAINQQYNVDTNGQDVLFASDLTSSGGSLTKSGLGILTLSGSNTYDNGTTLSEGTLALEHNNGAGTETIAMSDGTTLALNSSISVSNNVTLAGTSTVNVASGTGTLSGTLSSTGNLTKTGSGTLTLNGNNSYSGGTALSAGTLTLAHDNGTGTETIAMSNGTTLALNPSISASNNVTLAGTSTVNVNSGTGTLSGTLSSTGNLTKTGSGILNLAGSSTYTGTTIVSAGTLQTGSPSALSSSSAFTVDATLDVDHSNTIGSLAGSGTVDIAIGTTLTAGGDDKSTIFSGEINGTGNFTKDGMEILILSGSNGLTGTTTVSRGILDVRGSLSSSNISLGSNGIVKGSGNLGVLTASGGTISGTGTYNGIILNSGTISPGDSIGTINVSGDYSQAAGAVYEVEIDGSTSDKIIATGSATIDTGAILTIQTPTGSLFKGNTYNILTAAGGINQLWSVINYPEGFDFDLQLINGNTIAQLTYMLETPLFAGQRIDPGNPTKVKNYLQNLNIQSGTDLKNVVDVMDTLDDASLNKALNKLHPGPFGAFELVNLDNNALITSILSNQMIRLPCSENTCSANSNTTKGNNLWGSFFGNFTDVDKYQQLRGFDTYSGGLVLGYDHCFKRKAIFGIATGYEYARLDWSDSVGHADIHKAFGAVYGGYWIKRLDLKAAFLGGGDFYDVRRKISFSTLDRTAKNSHTDYFFTAHLRADLNLLKEKENFTKSLLLNLFGIIDYFYLYQPSYKEHGAQSLNLEVKKKNSNMMKSGLGINIAKDIKLSSYCIRPYLSFSWIRKFRLNGETYDSQFVDNRAESYILSVQTFSKAKDFFSPELGMIYTKSSYTLSIMYKGEFAGNYLVNQVKLNFQWTF